VLALTAARVEKPPDVGECRTDHLDSEDFPSCDDQLVNHETYLLHQVHPAKLAADITGDVISTALIWRGKVAAGVVAAFVPAIIGSAVVSRMDLSKIKSTGRGRYVLANMPPAAQAVRFLGQLLVWHAAYHHNREGIGVGHAVVLAGWCAGLPPIRRFRTRFASRRAASSAG
jgi:hypothetical protein